MIKSIAMGIGVGFVVLLVMFAAAWITQGNDFFMYKVFAPQYENVRRNTFENTKSYRQGMIQELQNMQFQYVQADDDHKTALADIILHRAADFDLEQNDVPADLYQFVMKLRHDRTK